MDNRLTQVQHQHLALLNLMRFHGQLPELVQVPLDGTVSLRHIACPFRVESTAQPIFASAILCLPSFQVQGGAPQCHNPKGTGCSSPTNLEGTKSP